MELELEKRHLGVLDGTLAVELPPPPEGSPPAGETIDPARVLERLRVEEGHLRYREPAQETNVTLALDADPSSDGPHLQARGQFRGAPVRADLRADPLPELMADHPYALDGALRVGKTQGKIHAVILSPPDLEDLKATFDLTGDFEQLAQLTGAPLPALPELNAEGLLRRSGPQWTTRELEIHLGDSDLSGEVDLDTSGERPRIRADLQSDTLDLTTLLPAGGDTEEASADQSLKVPAFLTELDAHLSYHADKIITTGPTIADLDLDTRLQDGRLRLGPLRLSYRQPEQETRLDVRMKATDTPGGEGLAGETQGRFRGRPLHAEMRTDLWLDLTEKGPPGAWQVLVAFGESKFTLAGDLRDLLSPETLDLKFSAQGPSPARLSDLVGVPLPDTPPYRLSASLSRDGQRMILDDVDGRVGASDLSGRMAADFANAPPDLNVRLSSDRLDYDDLTALIPRKLKEKHGKLFRDNPLGLEKMAGRVQGRAPLPCPRRHRQADPPGRSAPRRPSARGPLHALPLALRRRRRQRQPEPQDGHRGAASRGGPGRRGQPG